MVRDTVSLPARRGPAGLPGRRALLRRLPAPTAPTRWRCCAPRPRPAPRSSRCATPTAACCPPQVGDVVADVRAARTGARLGIHCHNDTGCAVANSLAAVDAGRHARAGHHQRLRRAHRQRRPAHRGRQPAAQAGPRGAARRAASREATRIAHAVSEVTNVPPYSRQPYVGASAFAHKAGLHASAIRIDPDLYQHTDPPGVGNDMRMLVSDMAGRASIELKGRELGYDLGRPGRAADPDRRPGQGPRAARATRSTPPTPPSRCCCAARSRGERLELLRRRVLARHHRLRRRGGGAVRGHGQARRRRPRGSSPPARATARSTRSTTRCARPSPRPTPRSTSSS